MLIRLTQPLTGRQLARLTGLNLDTCGLVLDEFRNAGLVTCLNPAARRSRLYWLTPLGIRGQRELCRDLGLPAPEHTFPQVDWKLYGWVCFRHRAAVIRTLVRPLQPAAIKRKARFQDPTLRMSANNVRDVIRLFVAKRIVQPVREAGQPYPRYALTAQGTKLHALLLNLEVVT